jgi:hypothetical protein
MKRLNSEADNHVQQYEHVKKQNGKLREDILEFLLMRSELATGNKVCCYEILYR